MSILRINGGKRLKGEFTVHGAKNAVLPVMAAAIISSGKTLIYNCPDLSDVHAAIKILRHLGCVVEKSGDIVYVDSAPMTRCDIPDALMREMRSSVIFLGAILARAGEAKLSMPGGCELGPRPIDLHLSALRTLGAVIEERNSGIICRAEKLIGQTINLSLPSVGATENAMIAAAGCHGKTVINNAAKEPEIVDLANYLGKTGVKISGAGTSEVIIEGGRFSDYVSHTIMPDRIVAATYLAAIAATGGEAHLKNIAPKHIESITETLSAMGCLIEIEKDTAFINAPDRLCSAQQIITRPYPGFPTDAQPPIMAACLKAEGSTIFVETIFKDRYRHAGELLRMGADIRTEGRVAIVKGVKSLHAAPVAATDLRGGAALVVAALSAEGTTEISGLWHIDRGYDGLETALKNAGGDIKRE